jgi:hypothetical protein
MSLEKGGGKRMGEKGEKKPWKGKGKQRKDRSADA